MNKWPNHKLIQLADAEFDYEIEASRGTPPMSALWEDLPADDGEQLSCILEKVLLTPKQPTVSQRNAIFHTCYIIEG